METALGYNVLFKIGDKLLAGTTSDSLTVTPTVKESIYKSLHGNKKYVVTGNEVAISVSGICAASVSTAESSEMRNDILEMALKVGSSAEFGIDYVDPKGDNYEGTGIITSYKEDSDSENEATYSAEVRIWNFTKGS